LSSTENNADKNDSTSTLTQSVLFNWPTYRQLLIQRHSRLGQVFKGEPHWTAAAGSLQARCSSHHQSTVSNHREKQAKFRTIIELSICSTAYKCIWHLTFPWLVLWSRSDLVAEIAMGKTHDQCYPWTLPQSTTGPADVTEGSGWPHDALW